MDLHVKTVKDGIKAIGNIAEGVRPAFLSALKSEANRLRSVAREYAESANFGPYSPTSTALRYRYQYGRFMGQIQRYAVDAANLTVKVGAISQVEASALTDAKGQWISTKAAGIALLHAQSRNIRVTLDVQRAIAGKLRKGRFKGKEGKVRTVDREARHGGYARWGGIGQFIPRIGTHVRRGRGVAEPVAMREAARTLRNIRQLMAIKMSGTRWDKDWAQQWGNEG